MARRCWIPAAPATVRGQAIVLERVIATDRGLEIVRGRGDRPGGGASKGGDRPASKQADRGAGQKASQKPAAKPAQKPGGDRPASSGAGQKAS